MRVAPVGVDAIDLVASGKKCTESIHEDTGHPG